MDSSAGDLSLNFQNILYNTSQELDLEKCEVFNRHEDIWSYYMPIIFEKN